MASRVAILVASLLAFSACVRPPAPLSGAYSEVSVRDARAAPRLGARVRWGGSIVAVTPHAEETCFEVVSHPLDVQARPLDIDTTDGRFVACARGFYDPAVYQEGREITVAGTIGESVDGVIGEHEYRFPSVDAEYVHLWPKREPQVIYRPVYDPFWSPFWWGPYYDRRRW